VALVGIEGGGVLEDPGLAGESGEMVEARGR
jgi:hypothetical protein